MHLVEGGPELDSGIIPDPPLEGRQYLGAAAALDRHDEGKAEPRAIGVIQLAELAQFLRSQPVKPGARMFGPPMTAVDRSFVCPTSCAIM